MNGSTYGIWADPDPADQTQDQNHHWVLLHELVTEAVSALVSQGMTLDQARVVVHNRIGCNMSLFMLIIDPWVLDCPDGCRSFIVNLAKEVGSWSSP